MEAFVLPNKLCSVKDPFALSSLSPILSPITAAPHQGSESEMTIPHEKGCPCQVNECDEWAALYSSPQSNRCLHQPERLFFPPGWIGGF